MRHRSNYDWMLFLTSPMVFVVVLTHDLVIRLKGRIFLKKKFILF